MSIDDGTDTAGLPSSVPVTEVLPRLLAAQAAVPPRGRLARAMGRSPLSDEARAWFWVASAALEVCRGLDRLGDEHHVLHAVPTSLTGDVVDHLVIGPSGVFAVHCASAAGQDVWVSARTFMIAGHRLPDLRQAEHSVGVVERCLSEASGIDLQATGVVAVVDPENLTVQERPRDVVVLESSQLVRWLSRRARVLDDVTVSALAAVAARPSTWFGPPSTACSASAHEHEFALLRREVARARLARQCWTLGATVAVSVVVVTIAIAATA